MPVVFSRKKLKKIKKLKKSQADTCHIFNSVLKKGSNWNKFSENMTQLEQLKS